MRRLIESVKEAADGDLKIEWLKPFMHPRSIKAGGRAFSKGDAADEAFLLVEGRIEISPEFGLYLVRLIVRRFEMNHSLEGEESAAPIG